MYNINTYKKGGDLLAIEKFDITDRLRKDIITSRKDKSISSYELSELSGHSKYWLQNIESGKTKKISKNDLISIYKVLIDSTDDIEVSDYVEKILNQQIGSEHKAWFDLIEINEQYEDILDEDELDYELDELLNDKLNDIIRDEIFSMPMSQKQAALTALLNLYYSFKLNPDLAFSLINIPVFGIERQNLKEYNFALNDLMATFAKYNDYVEKNNSMDTIKRWLELDAYYEEEDKKNIHAAYNSFIELLNELEENLPSSTLDLSNFSDRMTVDVAFIIERGQPNALKNYIQHFRIHNGTAFADCIQECVRFFMGFQYKYELPFIFDDINNDRIKNICNSLEKYGTINKIKFPPAQ